MIKQRAHEKSLKEIINNPGLIGLDTEDIDVIMKEPMMYENGVFIACPDLVFVCRDDMNHIVEYKHTYNPKAYEQLYRASYALSDTNIIGNNEMIFVYRDRKEKLVYERL